MEFAGLVLEDQLLDHLATPEGCMAVWRERLDPEIIPEINEGVREALRFVIAYIDEYGQPPDVAVLSEETGYEDFETPIAPIEYVIDKLKERKVRQELKRAITKVKERQLVKDSGISFGYEAIDNALGGMRKGELYFVVGRPGRYKSWQLIKSATESFQNGANVVIETLEMSAAEMQDRFLCMLAGVSWDQFQHGALPPKDEDILAEAHAWLADQSNKVFFHHPPLHERTVAHMRQFGIEVGADVLYVDQLSFIQANRKSDQQWIEVGYKCQELKEAASEFPILCAAQFNREAAKAKSVKDLDLANIGLSDSVGQTADLVLGLYANKDMMNNRLLQYGIVKSRSFSERAWEIKVNLGIDSNFYLVDELDWEDL